MLPSYNLLFYSLKNVKNNAFISPSVTKGFQIRILQNKVTIKEKSSFIGDCHILEFHQNIWRYNFFFFCRMVRLREAGIIDKLLRDSVAKSANCINPENQKITIKPLLLQDMYGILALFGGGKLINALHTFYRNNDKEQKDFIFKTNFEIMSIIFTT